ncbi:hypothetical protein N825_21215 [Skermanella stibiiresistens SB22]|uniref:Uncharacterized protein n=2 Tax=Skermanella TaxID=204447 RepID=W9GXT0_9PROT|nr:hypothetical protein N825_21215 [Skermanella stibiiresistens SB22]
MVGLVLTIAGFIGTMNAQNYTTGVHFSALVLCAGLAMVLVAFSGTITGTWKSWVMTGAIAAAPMLFLLQWQLQPDPAPAESSQTVQGNLGNSKGLPEANLYTLSETLYSRRHPKTQAIQFVALEQQITNSDYFSIQVGDDRDEPAVPGSPPSFTIHCVPTKLLKDSMKAKKMLSLTLQKASEASGSETWFVQDESGKSHGVFRRDVCPPIAASANSTEAPASRHAGLPLPEILSNLVMRPALAFDGGSDTTFEELIQALEAKSSNQRTAARLGLAERSARNPRLFATMAAAWQPDVSSYQRTLGLLVAWNRAIRIDRSRVVEIAASLDDRQILSLIAHSGYADETIASNAANLTSWLLQGTNWPNGVKGAKARLIIDSVLEGLRAPDAYFRRLDLNPKTYSALALTLGLAQAVEWSHCDIPPGDLPIFRGAVEDLRAANPDIAAAKSRTLEGLSKCGAGGRG